MRMVNVQTDCELTGIYTLAEGSSNPMLVFLLWLLISLSGIQTQSSKPTTPEPLAAHTPTVTRPKEQLSGYYYDQGADLPQCNPAPSQCICPPLDHPPMASSAPLHSGTSVTVRDTTSDISVTLTSTRSSTLPSSPSTSTHYVSATSEQASTPTRNDSPSPPAFVTATTGRVTSAEPSSSLSQRSILSPTASPPAFTRDVPSAASPSPTPTRYNTATPTVPAQTSTRNASTAKNLTSTSTRYNPTTSPIRSPTSTQYVSPATRPTATPSGSNPVTPTIPSYQSTQRLPTQTVLNPYSPTSPTVSSHTSSQHVLSVTPSTPPPTQYSSLTPSIHSSTSTPYVSSATAPPSIHRYNRYAIPTTTSPSGSSSSKPISITNSLFALSRTSPTVSVSSTSSTLASYRLSTNMDQDAKTKHGFSSLSTPPSPCSLPAVMPTQSAEYPPSPKAAKPTPVRRVPLAVPTPASSELYAAMSAEVQALFIPLFQTSSKKKPYSTFQTSIANCSSMLMSLAAHERDPIISKLLREISTALQSCQKLTYAQSTLISLTPAIRRMEAVNSGLLGPYQPPTGNSPPTPPSLPPRYSPSSPPPSLPPRYSPPSPPSPPPGPGYPPGSTPPTVSTPPTLPTGGPGAPPSYDYYNYGETQPTTCNPIPMPCVCPSSNQPPSSLPTAPSYSPPGTRSTPPTPPVTQPSTPPTRYSPPGTPSVSSTQYVPSSSPGAVTTQPDLPPSVPDLPTNEDVQNAIDTCAATLDSMVNDSRNRKNTQLFRKAAKALRSLSRGNFQRAGLRQLSANVQRLNRASARYRSNCQRKSSEIRNYDQLDDIFDDDGSNEDDDGSGSGNRRVAKAKRIMDAAAQCIEDYCGS
ncbi:unnamed protein product [Haemonchus placei]|uniref:SEA domain-containing protein n=1 Tax=Haemonchus placei TaxID=6290 RepID=A0A0N4WMV5_HAEPC|nr:unnamed protein product [Haemonchus placei]